MMWVLLCAIAFVVGAMMYSTIEDKLPTELQLPKSNGSGSQIVGASVGADKLSSPVAAWLVKGDGQNMEIRRDFKGYIEAKGQRYDAPALLLTCYQGELFVQVDLRMAVAGDPAKVKIQNVAQSWALGQGHSIYSPSPKQLLSTLKAKQLVEFSLPYAELGTQTAVFDTTGISNAVSALPASCKS